MRVGVVLGALMCHIFSCDGMRLPASAAFIHEHMRPFPKVFSAKTTFPSFSLLQKHYSGKCERPIRKKWRHIDSLLNNKRWDIIPFITNDSIQQRFINAYTLRASFSSEVDSNTKHAYMYEMTLLLHELLATYGEEKGALIFQNLHHEKTFLSLATLLAEFYTTKKWYLPSETRVHEHFFLEDVYPGEAHEGMYDCKIRDSHQGNHEKCVFCGSEKCIYNVLDRLD